MTTIDTILALADDYASSHNAHTIYRLKETRAKLRAALTEALSERDTAHGMAQAWKLTHDKVLAAWEAAQPVASNEQHTNSVVNQKQADMTDKAQPVREPTEQTLGRVEKYIAERAKMRGLDKELIHGLHSNDPREANLLASDLVAMVSALRAQPVRALNEIERLDLVSQYFSEKPSQTKAMQLLTDFEQTTPIAQPVREPKPHYKMGECPECNGEGESRKWGFDDVSSGWCQDCNGTGKAPVLSHGIGDV